VPRATERSLVTNMKNLLLAAALLGMAACSSTNKSAVGSAESASAPAAACSSECSTGGACCAEKAATCTGAQAECTGTKAAGEVCPVTGKPAN
jgi:hypothetical protein